MHCKLSRVAGRVILTVLLLLALCVSALAETPAVVNCDSLVVRNGPSTSAKKLGSLSKGTQLSVVSVSGSWAKVSYKGRTGYAAVKYLSKSASSSSTSSTSSRIKVYVTKKTSVYQKATSSSKNLGTVAAGTALYAVAESGSYIKVQNSSGSKTGYIAKDRLSKTKPSSSSSNGTKAEQVIALAKEFKGCPYVVGGTGPSKFDCSGLTYYCYKKVGVKLARSAQSQGYNNGQKLSKSELKAGDIVCFNTNPDDDDLSDHVGIYLGGGQFIHASSAAGKVIVSTLSSGYYARVFSWGRRVL